jgi:hypothetical protein
MMKKPVNLAEKYGSALDDMALEALRIDNAYLRGKVSAYEKILISKGLIKGEDDAKSA